MRLALYAHFSGSDDVARHVLFYLQKLRELGFQVCFISNSPISTSSKMALGKCCERIIQRENAGLDFAMWQQGLAEYDLSRVQELLLTNSSIVGPLKPLAALWRNPLVEQCDFWGLTDNDEIWPHLQSFFLVFKSRLIHSECFLQFWKSVLPYRNKDQIVRSYEVGLTIWLEQNGFQWRAMYPQSKVIDTYVAVRKKRSFFSKVVERLKNRGVPAKLPGRNTTLFFPGLLIAAGMPFLKKSLLERSNARSQPEEAFELLRSTDFPKDALDELTAHSSR